MTMNEIDESLERFAGYAAVNYLQREPPKFLDPESGYPVDIEFLAGDDFDTSTVSCNSFCQTSFEWPREQEGSRSHANALRNLANAHGLQWARVRVILGLDQDRPAKYQVLDTSKEPL